MHASRRRFIRNLAGAAACGPIAGTFALTACADTSRAITSSSSDERAPPAQSQPAHATPPSYRRLLVLVELKGGNDGLNTLVPYRDPAYYALRPTLAVKADAALPLSDRAAFHPALAPLLPYWKRGELAVLQGVGYPQPNLSHFRSIEIWDTASRSDQYLRDGWLSRAFASVRPPADFAADGFVIGSYDLGPLAGGARAITIGGAARLASPAMFAEETHVVGTPALAHILRTEADIAHAAAQLSSGAPLATTFPASGFGAEVRTACEVVARSKGVAVVRLTLNGFDTHANQAGTQARLLGELAEGLDALARGLSEVGRYDDALILTYAEFGRRPHENASGGTDHGTSSVHFALGGRVRGGIHGEAPNLASLTPQSNPPYAIDFRSVYATALDTWWGVDSRNVLGGRFAPLPIVRT